MSNNIGRGTLLQNAPLAEYTSWRVGGLADQIYLPADLADLSYFLKQQPANTPLYWLGLGSNVLIRDRGLRATVIITQGQLNHLEQTDTHTVRAEAGLSCAKVARFCARQSLVDVAFLAGVPGTIGGALAMNAGAFGGETWPWIEKVEMIDRNGNIHTRYPNEFVIQYREVKKPIDEEWFVAAHFTLQTGDKQTSLDKIRDCIARRANTQPTHLPSCGSTFRNPPNDYAARLIESCGLKNHRIGGAVVSEKHANFILNEGTATSSDIEQLIQHIQTTVENKTGIRLQREVHIIGEG